MKNKQENKEVKNSYIRYLGQIIVIPNKLAIQLFKQRLLSKGNTYTGEQEYVFTERARDLINLGFNIFKK